MGYNGIAIAWTCSPDEIISRETGTIVLRTSCEFAVENLEIRAVELSGIQAAEMDYGAPLETGVITVPQTRQFVGSKQKWSPHRESISRMTQH